jgi:phosphate transport system substrate-binding protein
MEEDPETTFARQAAAAGIVLPKKGRRDLSGAAVVVVALIVLTVGVGEVTGWVNLRTATPSNGGSFETQTCTGSNVQAFGSVSAAFDPAFDSWFSVAGEQLSQAVGGCFSVEVNSSTGDGYLPSLGGPGSQFAATYSPPTPTEAGQLPYPVAVLPIALSAVAVIYNLPGVATGLNLTGSILAGIYNGTITSWNSSAIVALNPQVDLNGLPPITVFQRAGTAVSNEVFSGFLAASSASWASTVPSGLAVPWPMGTSVDSDAAMLSGVAATAGSIGYLEIFGSPPASVGCAQIEDAAGDFAFPGPVDTYVAASSLANSSAVVNGSWTNFSFYRAAAPASYPLAALSYVGIYRDLGVAYAGSLSLSHASWILSYLYWLTGEPTVSPLPSAYVGDALNVLNNETYDGTTIVHLENENGEGGESGGETGEF